MQKQWQVKSYDTAKKSILDRLLAVRGILTEEDKKEFLNPLETKLSRPSVFCDMQKAVDRLEKAVNANEKILIYGDFDADGVTSTSLLYKALTHLGANVEYYIPLREKEGHGLNTATLIKLMATKSKPKVLITVDCGISDIEPIGMIKSFGVDVIVTDHHEALAELPKALAIINPKAPNALDEELTVSQITSLTSLAGVGVAFKLAQAVLERFEKIEFVYEIIPFVAVGTIADVVPLVGENRYFVMKGLELIQSGKHYGLAKLLNSAGYSIENGLTSENIAFGVAPRINACGRLESVEDAVKVMISENKAEIDMAVLSLENYNKIRQELCRQTFLEAEEMIENNKAGKNSIILFKPDWHVGIIGIVASKLVEKYHKPVFLMSYNEESQEIRSSARGVDGINLFDVISANSELWEKYGGHALAAGLSFSVNNLSFETAKAALSKTIDEMLEGKQITPTLSVDMELEENDLTLNLVNDIQKMQPFGASNPSPVFVLKNLILKQKKLMGSNRDHLKITVQKNDNFFDCIWWSRGDLPLINGDNLDIAFCPQINVYNGAMNLQLILEDIHAEGLDVTNVAEETSVKIYDHRKKSEILPLVEDYLKTGKHETLVFVENKSILQQLKPYSEISKRIVNRVNLKNSHSLMFFDYPASEEIFCEIISQVAPKAVHFMNYEPEIDDVKEILKTFSGMIKFACNNKSGVFNLNSSAAFLAQDKNVVKNLLDVFEQCGMIEILERDSDEFKIKFVANVEISKTLHTNAYADFKMSIDEAEAYRMSLLSDDIIIPN